MKAVFNRLGAMDSFQVIAMAKSLIKTWKKFVPESAEKKEKKKEEKEKSKEDKNGAEDDASGASLSSGSIGDKGNASFPPRPQPTSDQGWQLQNIVAGGKYS